MVASFMVKTFILTIDKIIFNYEYSKESQAFLHEYIQNHVLANNITNIINLCKNDYTYLNVLNWIATRGASTLQPTIGRL